MASFARMAAAHKMAIGRQIKKLREVKGWSQPRLAAEIPAQEVDAQQVSKWERGIHTPQKHLGALAEALGVEEGDILAGDRPEAEGPTPDPFATSHVSEADVVQLRRDLQSVADQLAAVSGQLAEVAAVQEQLRPLLPQLGQFLEAQDS